MYALIENRLKFLVQFLIFSSVHISIAAVLWGVITFLLLDANFNFSLIIIFLLTFFVYTFNRLGIEKGDEVNYPERVEFALRYGKIFLGLAVIGFIFAIFLSFSFGIFVMIITILPIIACIVYHFCKRYLLVKNFIIASIWACSVILVAASVNMINITVLSFFVFVFFRDFINSIFFDIRDIQGDKIANVKTIPIIIGVNNTLRILNIFNILSGALVILFVFFRFLPKFALFLIGLVFYNFFYYSLYRKGRINKSILFDLIADSEIYFAAFLILVGKLWL